MQGICVTSGALNRPAGAISQSFKSMLCGQWDAQPHGSMLGFLALPISSAQVWSARPHLGLLFAIAGCLLGAGLFLFLVAGLCSAGTADHRRLWDPHLHPGHGAGGLHHH